MHLPHRSPELRTRSLVPSVARARRPAGPSAIRGGSAGVLRVAAALGITFASTATSFAQTPVSGTPYYRFAESTAAWEPLLNPTTAVNTPNYFRAYNADVTLPFSFRYFENDFDQVTLSAGVIFLGGYSSTSYFNTGYGTSNPNNYIAPYWDYLEYATPDSGILYEVIGRAPFRQFAIEWRNAQNGLSNTGNLNFQLRLYEGNGGRMDVIWGPSTRPTFEYGHTMAMENANGQTVIRFASSNCTTSCSFTDFERLIGQRITFAQDAGIELVALFIEAPRFATLGVPFEVPVAVRNDHANVLGPFDLRVVASLDPDGSNPIEIGSGSLALGAFQTGQTTVRVTAPVELGERNYFLFLEVDPDNQIGEGERRNNSVASLRAVRLLPSLPDLRVDRVRLSSYSVDAPGSVEAYVEVTNAGSQGVRGAEIGVALSTNPVISPSDGVVASTVRDLAPGQTVTATLSLPVSADTNSGRYWVGGITDPEGQVTEIDEANNGRASARALEVQGGDVTILTTALPQALLGEAYFAVLRAAGGSGNYRWSTSDNRPPGIGVTPGGQFFGRPRTADCYEFTVDVTDVEDPSQTDSTSLELCVATEQQPLTVVTRTVPSAVVGQEYAFQLVATSRMEAPEPTWSATNLPDGFEVTSTGLLMGMGTEVGRFPFEVTAENGVDAPAQRTLILNVRESDTLQIVTTTALPPARVGMPYLHQLEAVGGIEPLTWSLRIDALAELGLDLSPEGEVSGVPTRSGRFSFIVDVRDSGGIAGSARDENRFELVIEDDEQLNIVTEALPPGRIGVGYDRSVAAVGGLPPYEWVLQGEVPMGIRDPRVDATPELRFIGTPEEEGVFRFRVTARDREGREASRAYVLVIEPATAGPAASTEEDGGCAATRDASGSSAGTALLFVLAGIVLARRRKVR